MSNSLDDTTLVNSAIESYGIDGRPDIIKKMPSNWHGDLHYKVKVGTENFSLRFVLQERSYVDDLSLSDDILYGQVKLGDFFVENGLPFMRRYHPPTNAAWTVLDWQEVRYRCLLYHWIEGQVIQSSNESLSFEIGKLVRRFHDTVNSYKIAHLPERVRRCPESYMKHVDKIRRAMKVSNLSSKASHKLDEYLSQAGHFITQSTKLRGDSIAIPIQGDFNFQNVICDGKNNIKGVVDLDQMGRLDRVEDLAWIIKWYSRSDSQTSHVISQTYALAIMEGYEAASLLIEDDYRRLPLLVWLSGCMNFNFVTKTLSILKENQNSAHLESHLEAYSKRGQELMEVRYQ